MIYIIYSKGVYMEIEKVSPKKIHDQLSSIFTGFWILSVAIILLSNIFPEKKNDVDPVLSMKDFGFETSYLSNSYLSEDDKEYHLSIKESEDSEVSFDLDVYNCKSEQVANSVMETKIKNIKKLELAIAEKCENCLFYEHDWQDIYKYIYELDEKDFNFDKRYALYELDNIPKNSINHNVIFLQKDNMLIQIEYYYSICLEINLVNKAIEQAINYVK